MPERARSDDITSAIDVAIDPAGHVLVTDETGATKGTQRLVGAHHAHFEGVGDVPGGERTARFERQKYAFRSRGMIHALF